MNLIKISLKTILTGKTVAILIMLSQIVNCVALLYTFSMTITSANSTFSTGEFLIEYEEPVDIYDIKNKISLFAAENYSDNIILILDPESGIVSSATGTVNAYLDRGELIQVDQEDNQAIIGSSTEAEIGGKIELLNKEYRVVGVSYVSDFSEVNYLSLDSSQKIYGVKIINIYLRNKKSKEAYITSLEQIFGRQVKVNEAGNFKKALSGNQMFLLMAALIGSSVISFILGNKYLTDIRKKSFYVMRLVGQSKMNLLVRLLRENLGLCIIFYGISSLLYFLLDILVFSKMVIYYAVYQLSFADYAIIGALYIVFVSLVLTLSSHRLLKRRFDPGKTTKDYVEVLAKNIYYADTAIEIKIGTKFNIRKCNVAAKFH